MKSQLFSLLPCPFCGEFPETYWDYSEGSTNCYNEGLNVICKECGIHQYSIYEEDAVEKWNTRIDYKKY